MTMCTVAGDRHRVTDETWAINATGGVIEHDLLFAMDDCKVQEQRAEASPQSNVAGIVDWLKSHPRFLTSRVYPDYTGANAFPLQEVMNTIGTIYLNNTVAYAVAYAIYIGVKKISLYGCDYSYQDFHRAESGRGCVEFLLGMAAARGIKIEVPSDTTLLDANVPEEFKPYGYDSYDVRYEHTESGLKVIMEERDHLPSPDDIENRYFRGKSPLPLQTE
jgi:hypothetical protein